MTEIGDAMVSSGKRLKAPIGYSPGESFAFARRELRFARNARGLGPRALRMVRGCRQPCGAARLRVAAAHPFASA